MDASRNVHEFPFGRRNAERARRVQLIVHALSDRFTGEPFPAMSEHYKPTGIPGEIGNVVVTRDVELKTELNRWQEEHRAGFNMMGDYVPYPLPEGFDVV